MDLKGIQLIGDYKVFNFANPIDGELKLYLPKEKVSNVSEIAGENKGTL